MRMPWMADESGESKKNLINPCCCGDSPDDGNAASNSFGLCRSTMPRVDSICRASSNVGIRSPLRKYARFAFASPTSEAILFQPKSDLIGQFITTMPVQVQELYWRTLCPRLSPNGFPANRSKSNRFQRQSDCF